VSAETLTTTLDKLSSFGTRIITGLIAEKEDAIYDEPRAKLLERYIEQ
jgi:hypothetical protein